MYNIKNKIFTVIFMLVISLLTGCNSTGSVTTETPIPEITPPISQSDTVAVTEDNANDTDIGTKQNTDMKTNEVMTEPAEKRFIGNKNSKKFHLSDCDTLPAEKNRVYFRSRDEAVENGFDPCMNCCP